MPILFNKDGFTLPTVMIVSIIMFGMLAVATQFVSASSNSLRDVHYMQLAKVAAESGLTKAEECMDARVLSWGDPLRPGPGCDGVASCAGGSCQYLLNAGASLSRSSFEVDAPELLSGEITLTSTGRSESLVAGGSSTRKEYVHTAKKSYAERKWSQVSSGGAANSCALDTAGKAYCWGWSGSGQLGNNSTTNSLVPVSVIGLPGVHSVF